MRRAPKALLHDHLDGGLRPATVIDIAGQTVAQRNNCILAHYGFEDAHFNAAYKQAVYLDPQGLILWSKTVGETAFAVRLALEVNAPSEGDLRLTFPEGSTRLSLPQLPPSSDFFPALAKLKEELEGLVDVLEENAERAETLEQCRVRAVELLEQYKSWKSEPKKRRSAESNPQKLAG